jgi:hypothetical protein
MEEPTKGPEVSTAEPGQQGADQQVIFFDDNCKNIALFQVHFL